MRPRHLLVPFAIGLFAACGGDEGDGRSASPPDLGDTDSLVEVLAEDISFPEDVYVADAGRVGFVYENVGNIRHTLVIEGVDSLDLTVDRKGDVDGGAADLEPGTYVLFCDVPGHRPAGMVADLVVS